MECIKDKYKQHKEHTIMSELGTLLKKTRENQGKTLLSVKNDTRIQESFLTAIEDGNFYALPSYIHVYGFVKKYAEYLGFDYGEIKPLFDKECPKSGVVAGDGHGKSGEPRQLVVSLPKPNTPIKKKAVNEKEEDKIIDEILAEKNEAKTLDEILPEKKEIKKAASEKQIATKASYNNRKKTGNTETSSNIGEKKHIPITGIIVGGVIILALMMIFSNVAKDKKPTPMAEIDVNYNNTAENVEKDNTSAASEIIPPEWSLGAMLAADNITIDEDLTDNITDNATVTDNATTAPIVMATPLVPATIQPASLILSFTDECWVKFTPDNKTSTEFTAQAGTNIPLKFEKTFVLDIGNAAAVSMNHEGRTYSGFGRPGTVRKLIYELQNGSLIRATN